MKTYCKVYIYNDEVICAHTQETPILHEPVIHYDDNGELMDVDSASFEIDGDSFINADNLRDELSTSSGKLYMSGIPVAEKSK